MIGRFESLSEYSRFEPSPLSFRALLIDRIGAALRSTQILVPSPKALPPNDLAIAPSEISLNRLKGTVSIRYVSAIAFRLAHQWQIGRSPLDIAQMLTDQLNHQIGAAQASENPQASDPIGREIWLNFTVQMAEPGWIYLQPSDRGVAIWLQSLIGSPIHFSNSTSLSNSTKLSFDLPESSVANIARDIRNSTRLFPLLHTHVRCCSLLQLADQTGIIRLDRSELAAESVAVPAIEPYIFPWLLEPESTQLRCQHPAEQQLISQLVQTFDQLDIFDRLHPERLNQSKKLAQALSRDFQFFHAACRIWGEIAQTDLPIAQTRLGLVWIVQKVMRSLLAELGIAAPIAL